MLTRMCCSIRAGDAPHSRALPQLCRLVHSGVCFGHRLCRTLLGMGVWPGQGRASGLPRLNIQREGVAGAQKPSTALAWTIPFLVTSPCACCWVARVRGGGSGPGPLPLRLQNLAKPRQGLPCRPPTAGWSMVDHCGDPAGPGLEAAVGIHPSSGQAQPCSPETERLGLGEGLAAGKTGGSRGGFGS